MLLLQRRLEVFGKLLANTKAVSSMYIITRLRSSGDFERSLVRRIKSAGPSKDPSGTLLSIGSKVDLSRQMLWQFL